MKELWRLPVAPSAIYLGPEISVLRKRTLELKFSTECAKGGIVESALRFEGVEAYRCTYATSLSADMIHLAYGALVALDSEWLEAVRTTGRKQQVDELFHAMITFDDGPCYEIICRSWSIRGHFAAQS